jgi:hypothetical protein
MCSSLHVCNWPSASLCFLIWRNIPMQRCLNLTWQNSWYWPGFSVPFEEEERTRLIAMCKWKHRFKQWPVTHHSSSLFWIKDLNTRSTCFTFCSFNTPCQLTPFLNLRLLVFGLAPFRWLLCVTLRLLFLIGMSFLIYTFWIYACL